MAIYDRHSTRTGSTVETLLSYSSYSQKEEVFYVRMIHISLCRSVLDRKLAPTVVPLLRTLVRLCVDPIDPSHDVSVRVSFGCRYDDDAPVELGDRKSVVGQIIRCPLACAA